MNRCHSWCCFSQQCFIFFILFFLSIVLYLFLGFFLSSFSPFSCSKYIMLQLLLCVYVPCFLMRFKSMSNFLKETAFFVHRITSTKPFSTTAWWFCDCYFFALILFCIFILFRELWNRNYHFIQDKKSICQVFPLLDIFLSIILDVNCILCWNHCTSHKKRLNRSK